LILKSTASVSVRELLTRHDNDPDPDEIKIINPSKISLQSSNICDTGHLAVAVKQLFNLLTVVPHADALLQHYGSRRNSANFPYSAYPDVLPFS
jgi:hypothetical protein